MEVAHLVNYKKPFWSGFYQLQSYYKEINTASEKIKTDLLDMIIINKLNCRKGRIDTNTLMHEYLEVH